MTNAWMTCTLDEQCVGLCCMVREANLITKMKSIDREMRSSDIYLDDMYTPLMCGPSMASLSCKVMGKLT